MKKCIFIIFFLIFLPIESFSERVKVIGGGGGGTEVNNLETITTDIAANEVPTGTGANTVVYKLLPDCNVAGSALNYEDSTQTWSCRAGLGGGSFDSTTVDDTTWSDNANATNTWTFDVSGTDHTAIFGSAITTWSGGITTTLDLIVNGLDITLGATGVKFTSDNDGAFTMLGLSAGFDEDWSVNLDDTENTVVHGTSTGVTEHDWGTIGLATDSLDLSEGNITNGGIASFDSLIGEDNTLVIGDNSETIAINSSDWDIGTTGTMTNFLIDGDDNTLQDIAISQTKLVAGAGLSLSTDTLSTASGEEDFLANGALTCGANTAGKAQIHTTPLQYCDNAATPALQYAAYGNSSGNATSATTDTIDAITEIAAAIKSGSDGTLATGTAGATSEIAIWDVNGDLIDANLIVGTLTDERVCEYESTGTFLICDTIKDSSGACAAGSICAGGHTHAGVDLSDDIFLLNNADDTTSGTLTATGYIGNLYDASGAVDLDIGSGDVLDITLSEDGGTYIFDNGLSMGEDAITNVGDIALDSISSDGASIVLGSGDENTYTQTGGTSHAFALGSDGGDDFTIDTTGFVYEGDGNQVGIGTASPWESLVVVGDQTISDDSPRISLRDSDDDVSYAWHLITGGTDISNLSLLRGTDDGSTGFTWTKTLAVWDDNNNLALSDGLSLAKIGNISGKSEKMRFTIIDPNAFFDVDTQFLIWADVDAAITITRVYVTCDGSGNEIAGDIKHATAFIGLGSATLINDFDTTSGVRDDPTIAQPLVAAGLDIYGQFDSQPNSAITQCGFTIEYDYD